MNIPCTLTIFKFGNDLENLRMTASASTHGFEHYVLDL